MDNDCDCDPQQNNTITYSRKSSHTRKYHACAQRGMKRLYITISYDPHIPLLLVHNFKRPLTLDSFDRVLSKKVNHHNDYYYLFSIKGTYRFLIN